MHGSTLVLSNTHQSAAEVRKKLNASRFYRAKCLQSRVWEDGRVRRDEYFVDFFAAAFTARTSRYIIIITLKWSWGLPRDFSCGPCLALPDVHILFLPILW